MVDFNRMTATLWRSAEDEMRHRFGDPNVMAQFIPYDRMDDYQRARSKDIALNLHDMLDHLTDCVKRNLDEFELGQLPSCLRGKTERD